VEAIVSDRKSILLVCDDELVCRFTEMRLKRLGYRSIAAPTTEAARLVFKHNSEKFDLVMVDHTLFDGNGIDLASELLDIRPNIPIALSGVSLTIDDMRPRGIRAVIPKVLTINEFDDALERVFDAA
jgi:DNA-binding NtrC family response regulator